MTKPTFADNDNPDPETLKAVRLHLGTASGYSWKKCPVDDRNPRPVSLEYAYKDVERYSIERDITALCDRCLYLGSGCHTRQPAVAVRCHGDSLGRQQTLSQWVVCNPTASPFLSRSANTIYLTDGDGLPRVLTAQASKALRRTNSPARIAHSSGFDGRLREKVGLNSRFRRAANSSMVSHVGFAVPFRRS